jgi:conjugal transfer pilus assembly protein TraL
MAMQSDAYIPRRLDDAWKIGLWDVDVAVPALFGFFLGWMSGTKLGFAIAAGLGLYVSRWISRVKSDKHPAYFLHWAYWSLPTNPLTALRATPPSHIRRMVG